MTNNGTTDSALTTVPDMLGSDGLARIVGDFIRDLQGQRAQVDVLQVANQATDADPLPNNPNISYGERRTQINDGIREVCAKFEDVMDAVRALVP